MKKTFRTVLNLAAAILLSLGFAGTALAVDQQAATPIINDTSNISISLLPAQQRLVLEPGETVTAQVTVVNSGDVEYEAKVYAAPYTVSEDYKTNIFEGEGSIFSQIYRWINFNGSESTDKFVLSPHERKTIEFTVEVPKNVPAGGQYAGIVAEIIPPSNSDGIVAVRRVASLLYSNIKGETIDKGEVTGRVWRSFFVTSDIKTSLTIKNSGNTDFGVENTLKVTNLFGKTVYEQKEPSMLLFPETSRSFDLNWDGGSAFGIYHLIQESKFLDQTITESKLIIIMPIWLIIVIIAAIVAIIVIIRRRVKKKHVRRYKSRA